MTTTPNTLAAITTNFIPNSKFKCFEVRGKKGKVLEKKKREKCLWDLGFKNAERHSYLSAPMSPQLIED